MLFVLWLSARGTSCCLTVPNFQQIHAKEAPRPSENFGITSLGLHTKGEYKHYLPNF